jgi:endonuclease/exonuclease/phosphatase (EEP) superfamily protein YafD
VQGSRPLATGVLHLVTWYPEVAALTLLVVPALGSTVGPLALLTIMAPHLAIAGLLFAPFALVRSAPAHLRLGVLFLILAMAVRLGPDWLSLPPGGDTSDHQFDTATWNLELGARSGEGAVEGLRNLDVDVVALQELGPDHVAAIEAAGDLAERYPASSFYPDDGVLGIGLLSRHPIVSVSHTTEPTTIEAVLDVHGQHVTVITAHPLPGSISMVGPAPVSFDARQRDLQLLRVRNLVGYAIDRGETVIVLGDFNAAPTEAGYGQLTSGLRDAHVEVGQGPGWTWRPSRLEWTGLGFLRIDLALSGPGARPIAVQEHCGLPGDHCQLEAAFQLVPPSVEPVFLLLPGQTGDVPIRALPVEVSDGTGLLVSANAAVDPFATEGASAVPGQPKRIRLTWIGGACDRNATMRLAGDRVAMWVAIETTESSGACPAVGVFRTIELSFAEVVDPSSISVGTT